MSEAIAAKEANVVMLQKIENDQSFKRQAEESGIHSAGSNFSSSTGRTTDFSDASNDSKISENDGIKVEIDESTQWCVYVGEVTDSEAFSIVQSSNVDVQNRKENFHEISAIEHSNRAPKLAMGKFNKTRDSN